MESQISHSKNSVQANLKSGILKVIKELGVSEEIQVNLETPADITHGDYTTSVAMQAFASEKRKAKSDKKWNTPLELAKEIASRLSLLTSGYAKAEALAPGFINFWISEDFLLKNVEKIIKNPQDLGKSTEMDKKKIVVEFTDANPFKEFHIGHLYTNTVGESLCRLFESQGATVWRADYFGDVGMHVAKSLWGLQAKFKEDNVNLDSLEKKRLNERIQYLGQAYAKGATAYEESDTAKEEIKIINRLAYIAAQKMWEKEEGMKAQVDYAAGQDIDPKQLEEIYAMYTLGRKWSMEYFESMFSRLGMKFDGYYPESKAGEKGYKLVKDHIKDGIFEENDGAIIFKGKDVGLHTRVFINSLGLPTYEAKELGLAPWKYEDFSYDYSYIVTGSEIFEYFKVLIAAMMKVEPSLGKKTQHVPHGMVRTPEGKMSSRTGKIITGEWLLDEAKRRVIKLVKEREGEAAEEIAEEVAIAAIKFAFLKSGIGSDIIFDFDSSLSFEGASGPYLQYSYVRTQSILEKAKREKKEESNYLSLISYHLSLNADELLLLRKIYQFDEVVLKAAKELAPSVVCTYLFDLAKAFSSFYQANRIVDAPQEKDREFRLLLTQAIGSVLAKGLSLLGIVAPKRM